jgi:hypothetical protein
MIVFLLNIKTVGLYMATNISHRFNLPESSWTATLKRPFTLRRLSKNTFTPNLENHAPADRVETLYRTVTLKRFQKKEILEQDTLCLRNRAETLGRMSKGNSKVASEPLTALEQAKKLFSGFEQEDFHTEKSSLQVLSSKTSNEINKKLEQAKNSFQKQSYKEAKKRFKKINQSKPLHQEKMTTELYLATIYLLQDNAYKAKKYLEGKPEPFKKGNIISFTQAMYSHVSYLIKQQKTPERVKGPCLAFQLYEKAEGFSEDEKIMAEELSKKFCISND